MGCVLGGQRLRDGLQDAKRTEGQYIVGRNLKTLPFINIYGIFIQNTPQNCSENFRFWEQVFPPRRDQKVQ